MSNLGSVIRELREQAKMSPEDLASKAEVSYSLISKLETKGANISLKTLERLAQALKVTPAILLEQAGRKRK